MTCKDCIHYNNIKVDYIDNIGNRDKYNVCERDDFWGLVKNTDKPCKHFEDKDILKEIHEKIANIPIPYDSRDNADVQYGECLIRNAILHMVSEYLQESVSK